MDFGKLQDITRVDFRLPPDAAENPEFLAELRAKPPWGAGATEKGVAGGRPYRVGCPVWSRKDWIGKVFPQGARPGDFLKHYAGQFWTVELNSTHYGLPETETLQSWKNAVSTDFRFVSKVPRTISHEKELRGVESEVQRFLQRISLLAPVLGRVFLQLPPSFTPAQLPQLRCFLELLTQFPELRAAVEFRHPAWFSPAHRLRKDAASLLERHQAVAVITDVAGRRDVLHQTLTTSAALIRFVGNGLHPTDRTRIDAWVERLQYWIRSGLREFDFFMHQPDDLLAPDLADYFVERMNGTAGVRLPVRRPPVPPEASGHQLTLFS